MDIKLNNSKAWNFMGAKFYLYTIRITYMSIDTRSKNPEDQNYPLKTKTTKTIQ